MREVSLLVDVYLDEESEHIEAGPREPEPEPGRREPERPRFKVPRPGSALVTAFSALRGQLASESCGVHGRLASWGTSECGDELRWEAGGEEQEKERGVPHVGSKCPGGLHVPRKTGAPLTSTLGVSMRSSSLKSGIDAT